MTHFKYVVTGITTKYEIENSYLIDSQVVVVTDLWQLSF